MLQPMFQVKLVKAANGKLAAERDRYRVDVRTGRPSLRRMKG